MATLAYFTVPKLLDTDERYRTLSVEARYLYAHMRDTLKLSIKNNWQDRLGYFIKMSRARMGELLHRSAPTVRKIVRELIAAGLIRERRVGLTQANRFYIQPLPGETLEDLSLPKKAVSPSGQKPDFAPDRNPLSPNKRNPSNPHANNPQYTSLRQKNAEATPRKDWKWFLTEGSKWFDNKTGKYWQMLEGEIHPLLFGDELKDRTADLLRQLGMSDDEARAMSY